MSHLCARAQKAFCDGSLGILTSLVKAVFQRLNGGRENKDADRFREMLAHLASALPVDFQEHIAAREHAVFNPFAGSAVIVSVNLGPF